MPRCVGCRLPFVPEPRAAGRQRFCRKPECRRKSKRESQRRWIGRPGNDGYFAGPIAGDRVRAWRKAHPGYARRRRRVKAVVDLGAVLREVALQDPCGALQDSCRPWLAGLLGLLAWLRGSALQETIARDFRDIMVAGNAILADLETQRNNGGVSPGTM